MNYTATFDVTQLNNILQKKSINESINQILFVL